MYSGNDCDCYFIIPRCAFPNPKSLGRIGFLVGSIGSATKNSAIRCAQPEKCQIMHGPTFTKRCPNMSATHFMCKSVYNIDIITLCSSVFIYFLSLLLLCTYYSRVYPPMTSFNPLLNQPLLLGQPSRHHFFSQVQDISFACLEIRQVPRYEQIISSKTQMSP